MAIRTIGTSSAQTLPGERTTGAGGASVAKKGAPDASAADAVAGAKPGPLGGAVRAPAGSVALPALGGRPKADTFESVWKALGAAFGAAKPGSLEAAIGVLGELGFTVDSAKGDHAKLKKGDYEVRIEADAIGAHAAIHLHAEGPASARKGADELDRKAVVMGGALIPKKLFGAMKDRYDDVLKTFDEALEANGKKPLPTTFDALKTFIEGGKSEKARAKDAVQDAEVAAQIDALTAKIELLQEKGLAPQKIIIYTDGPDGAGKSSTGAIVLQSIAKAGYTTDVVSFKAPTAAEREQHWLQRFEDRGIPAEPMSARFWDRGPAGDAVYGKKTPEQAKAMAKELKALERDLAGQDVLLFKVHIFADQEKQADTFGKRLARQTAADLIEQRLAKSGKLTDATKDALANIKGKIDGDDLNALVNYEPVQASFLRFSKAAGYAVVDATDRHAARLQIIEALSQQLDAYAAAKA